jgi:hypothetical protein
MCTAAASVAGFALGTAGGFACAFLMFLGWVAWRLFR